MTINEKIRSAVTPYVPACVYGGYVGEDKTYCYFLLPKTEVLINGSDEPIIDLVPVQIHLYTASDFQTLKKQIRASLFKNGFTYPDVTCLFESDTKLNHIIFECEIRIASEKEEV